jgi:two-component system CheB/CheR fusion protein
MALDNLSQERALEPADAPPPGSTPDASPLLVVGMGASAGGIRALQHFFTALPGRPGMVFVVVVHLSPDHESTLAQVLQAYTPMPVAQVRGRVRLEPDHVYVIPPSHNLKLSDGHLIVTDIEAQRRLRAPIDMFFRTLAEQHPDGIGILLSGGGTDGMVGMKAIKEHGGLLMVQSPEEAEYETMPRSAIATGLVDFVLPAAELAAELLKLRQHERPARQWEKPDALPESDADAPRQILRLLEIQTGHDFSGYKSATMLRRLERRRRVTQTKTLTAYLTYLHSHAHEAQALLKDLLISVTTFFRDRAAFEALWAQVIPQLFAGKGPGDKVRVWVPGCATGEEAYTIAMLLLEQADTLETLPQIQIFASDIDKAALTYARNGLYPEAIAVDVSEARLQRFFVREGHYYRVKPELRALLLFALHNLLKEPPFSQLSLISCRNLLIYLQRDWQEKVMELFHYALKPEGYLFLGSAENLDCFSGGLFRAIDSTHRLYRRAQPPDSGSVQLPELPLSATRPGRFTPLGPRPMNPSQSASEAELHRKALEAHAPPSLLVDADANIIHVSDTANRYLQFPSGVPSLNLYSAALPELQLHLKIALSQALGGAEATFSAPVPVEIRGQRRLVQLYVAPVTRPPTPRLALAVFAEGSLLAPETQSAAAPVAGVVDPWLHHLEDELEATRTQLRTVTQASETQYKELMAANEELLSINEEYKSTLEELETSQEELQSINEELWTVNQELQERLHQISQANNDFQNLMAATDVATLFVDRELRIKFYTPPLTELFNIMPVDQGRPLAHMTHRLSNRDIQGDIQQVLGTLASSEHEVQRDDGRTYLMRLTPYRTSDDRIDGMVLTFIDITTRKQAEQRVRALVARLTMAEQGERRRLSQILHDDLQQRLYSMQIHLRFLRQEAQGEETGSRERLLERTTAMEAGIAEAIKTTRQLTVDLSPPVLKDEGLTAALHWLRSQMQEMYGLEVELTAAHAFRIADEDMRVLLFQIVRELLFNVVKHAGVNRATVNLHDAADGLIIRVHDEGHGFHVAEAARRSGRAHGFGLVSVRERLHLVGGTLAIETAPGAGTRVVVRVPVRSNLA